MPRLFASCCHVARAAVLAAIALASLQVKAGDSEPASVRWMLYGSGEELPTQEDAVRVGCERLRKNPPTSVNSVTRVSECGKAVSVTASARNYKVAYRLQAHDPALDHDTSTESTFLIQRKAVCTSTAFPYLREDDASRFQYSCWRCPVADLRPQAPRFVAEHTVQWFRTSQCPLQFEQTREDDGSPLRPAAPKSASKIPLANGLSPNDHAAFRLLRDAAYGRLAELRFANGERIFFVGDGDSNTPLSPELAQHGQLALVNDDWIWTTPDRTQYHFGPGNDGYSKVASKHSRDGKIWRFSWQAPAAKQAPANTLAIAGQLESMIDPSNQSYRYIYDGQGRLASIIMKGANQR
ncbi:RHS repeat protein [Permianibacter sp. IMCC34836]|uniref:RHS repeat domain-containing protein n=1 Tax=Permianibacter fluminis TaxID=2738515 RepID=UPI001554AAA2|nr:RHS repeat domain-containing protein [Permianibacter fluminis]NQD36618.1 RHS repeat protein [Permianibacter fluminis]